MKPERLHVPDITLRRARFREESLKWLATRQAERELQERLELHRELAGMRR